MKNFPKIYLYIVLRPFYYGGKSKIYNITFLALFLFGCLIVLSLYLISSNFAVKAQQPHTLFSDLPENLIAFFINDQSTLANSTHTVYQNSFDKQTNNEESMGVEVLEDLPRGSTRIEDIDNLSETDILITDNQLEHIQKIVDNSRIVRGT